ncbi:hypothetical protein [Vibrio jasicida]|uniref:hypothetical protein n=1 Tax=Vibrio jasicida TaxID=766224 RepID=UPI000AA283BD
MRHLFRLMLLLSLALFSGQMVAAHAHDISTQNFNTSQKLAKLSQQDYASLKAPFLEKHSDSSWGKDGYFRFLKRDFLGLLPYRRNSGDDGELPLNIKPDYHLLVAFLSPPLLAIALKATPLPDDNALDGKLPFHLSGWKQANLLYVFKHGRESMLAV